MLPLIKDEFDEKISIIFQFAKIAYPNDVQKFIELLYAGEITNEFIEKWYEIASIFFSINRYIIYI